MAVVAQQRSSIATVNTGLGLWALYVLPFLVTFYHIKNSPYTKVEESFGLHAVHDILKYGLLPSAIKKFDHVEFPGAVARSFLPSIILAGLSYPVAALAVAFDIAKTTMDIQLIVRGVLASTFCLALNRLTGSVARRFGSIAGALFLLLSLTQFHVPYYASRTLPNFMAMPPFIYAVALLLDTPSRADSKKNFKVAIAVMTFTATVVRLELALFVVPLALNLVAREKLSLEEGLIAGAIGGFSGLAASVSIDSYLWSKLTWPEAAGVYFNIYEGKASAWGVSPSHHYITGLPRMLLLSTPLLLLGLAIPSVRRSGLLGLLLPSVAGLVGGMSCVGHKEWRFVAYVVPCINVIAAVTASHLWNMKTSKIIRNLFHLALIGGLVCNMAASAFMAFVSSHNYPGGEVERMLSKTVSPKGKPWIHYHAYPLMNGASLFTFTHAALDADRSSWLPSAFPAEMPQTWEYSKAEDQNLDKAVGAWHEGFDFVVTEKWKGFAATPYWSIVTEIPIFDRVSVRSEPKVRLRPAVGIVERVTDVLI